MTLTHLVPDLQSIPAVETARAALLERGFVTLAEVPVAVRPAVIAALSASLGRPVLVVTARDDRARDLEASLAEYLPPASPPRLWDSPDGLPWEQLPRDPFVSAARVALLADLLGDSPPPVVISAMAGLTHYVMPPADLAAHSRTVTRDQRMEIDDLFSWAARMGYEPTPLVQEPGSIARRGGILDLYPPAARMPVRVEFFGDTVESIRTFNPTTQRSDARMERAVFLPPSELPLWNLREATASLARLGTDGLREEVRNEWARLLSRMEVGATPVSVDLFAPWLMESPATLLDYLPADTVVVIDEPGAVTLAGVQRDRHAGELVEGFEAKGELPVGLKTPFQPWQDVEPRLLAFPRAAFGTPVGESTDDGVVTFSAFGDAPNYAGRMSRLTEDLEERLAAGWRVAIASDQVDRLTEILEERDIFPRRDKRRGDAPPPPLEAGTVDLRPSDLDGGWMAPDLRLLVLTDLELFGYRKETRRTRGSRRADSLAFATSLTPGEFVVHVDHGIAKFTGLVRAENGGVEREYLLLEYQRGDRLYVPVDQSDRVTRYSGGGLDPVVTRLGSGEWARTKGRVRRAIREMAWQLIQLYAARETARGFTYAADTAWDNELAESFPFTETVDQLRAINDVRGDLMTDRPMDRLVCGDVGFGKTEVALRAAFKAVNNGKQVAVLVPTTVLALQHYSTFSHRLAAFPVRVEMLSRLRSPAEQRDVVAGLADGSVDIVIGTHRLVSKDVKFRDLGLVIIDEEQRFGVRQKEHLKQLRTQVDVLTMSATPIPRTLHMSLAGIRDISLIETAPQERLPIRTFVTEGNDQLLREVIMRELERGGQVYVVHNRVSSIDRLAHHLRELVPEARIGVGHGQMEEQVLEEVILQFVQHDYDVLVCTTIIESGIDIANVNTIVIDNADMFGLTQLYQLRGRVGRSTNRAYAYLLYKPMKQLSEEAQARLEAIQEATELGAGLRVAMRDMEIRGAGNLLGAEQSGHIAEIGYDLYVRLLAQAVEEARTGTPIEEMGSITLDLPITALIPASYIVDMELRLATYRQVAAVTDLTGLAAMRVELEDRFGPVPPEVEHLFALIALRLRCQDLGIESVVEREREIVIRPVPTSALDQRRLVSHLGGAIRFTPNSIRVRLPDLDIPWQEALDAVLDATEVARDRVQAAAG